MKKKNTYLQNQKGFALTGSMIVIFAGLTALLGGGAYVANVALNDDSNNWQGQGEMQDRGYRGNGGGSDKDHSFVPDYKILDGVPVGELSAEEREGLVFMIEEEKLTRDVYRTMYDKWGVRIFQNISYAENRHGLAVQELLDRYGIDNPIQDDSTGIFVTPEMQKLYDDLVAQGNKSLLDALKVGATIEDLDIYDLQNWIEKTNNEDIKIVYENLLRGSRNHMRVFDKQIKQNGGAYEAQYLTQVEIDEILSGEQERGNHNNGGAEGIMYEKSGQQGMGQGQGGQGHGYGNGRGMSR